MPPRTRRKSSAATQKETPVTTTEVVDDQAPEDTEETEETRQRRAKVKPEDAVFFAGFEASKPPTKANARTYVRTPYDDVLEQQWQRYQDAGSPAWSLSGGLTKDDKPADGWWSDRDDIWMSTVVPDVVNAESLLKRAAGRLGCSYRFLVNKDDDGHQVEEPDGGFRIWFTAAPVLRKQNT